MTTLNDTAFCASASQTDFIGFCILMPTFMCLLSVFICGGNLLTITAVCSTRSLQTTPNMYVVSLAVADLIVGFNVFFESFWYNALTEGDIAHCKFCCLSNLSTLYTSLFASMASVVLIAVDRFLYICYPFKYEDLVTQRKTQIVIIVTWIISLILGTFPLYLNSFDAVQECAHTGVLPVWYQIYFEEQVFASVLILCLVLYAGIMNIARRQLRSIQATTVDPAHNSAEGKNWKVVRLMLLVCGGFFVCWCPYHVSVVINHVSFVSEDVMDVLFPLGILNSGVNFIIYALMNRDFRQAFRRRVCCCRRFWEHDSSGGATAQTTLHLNGLVHSS
ncbi:histamine H2 receptor-like [Gigantopelta aegis]|uniref:histamine H2 receptor-like n=1 Tax=Gigantopelta aegis TaxID=1735272 RepID=UPI001B88C2B8|nr:histamine H2 receptor-like [Gigantopelta aegis]